MPLTHQLATTKYFFISCTNKHLTAASLLKTTEKRNTTIPASPVAQQAGAGKTLPAVPVLQKAADEEEGPLQLRSVAPFQFMAAGAVIQLLAMKGAAVSRRTSGSGPALTRAVNALIRANNLGNMNSASNQLRTSIANRTSANYRPLDAGHAARITLEEGLYARLEAAIAALRPAPAPAPAPAAAAPAAGGGGIAVNNPFDALPEE